MKTIFDLCKRLDNPIRRELLRRVYTSRDGGANVGLAQDNSGLGMSGTSQYLKQLEELGLIRRERAGRYVNYLADWSQAPGAVQEIAALIHRRFSEGGDLEPLEPVFHSLMNPFRGRAIHWLSTGGSGDKAALCERFNKRREVLARDLQPAVEAGLLEVTDDDSETGAYVYRAPADPLARRLIDLAM